MTAFAIWWEISRQKVQNLNGFVFRKRIGTDSISVDPTDAMVHLTEPKLSKLN